MKLNRRGLALFIILSIGFILRIYHLNAESFWLDECISVSMAKLDLGRIIPQHYNSFHPPFYYLILHFWIKLVGDAEASTRFLSVMIGLASIFMIYRLGRLIFNKEAGILSAFLLSISVYHIRFSQETRMYNLAVLLALISMYFFIKLLGKHTRRTAVYYLVSTFLMMITHYSALLIILVQNIYVFTVRALRKKESGEMGIKSWLVLQSVFLILCLPFLGIWLRHLAHVQQDGRFWLSKPSVYMVVEAVRAYAGSYILLPLLLIPALLSILGGMSLLTFVWLVAPQAMLFALSVFSASLYSTKYMLTISPPLYLLTADGLRRMKHPLIKAAFISAIVIFSMVALTNYYSNIQKPQWRDAVRFIEENVRPGDLLVLNDKMSKNAIFDSYYFKRRDVVEMLYPGEITTAPYILPNVKETKNLLNSVSRYNRVWIVLSHVRDVDGMITRIFGKTYRLAGQRRYNVIFVYLFEKK